MAEREKEPEQTSETAESGRREKRVGFVHSIIVVFLAVLIVVAISAGVFYFMVKNNVRGIADTLRPYISDNAILSLALPAAEGEDPDAPENLSEKELLKKYDEYRARTKELDKNLKEANDTIEQLKKEAQQASDASTALAENQAALDQIKEEQAKLEADKKAFSEAVAQGDPEGFKAYFQKIDKAAAESIYEEITEKDAANQRIAELAKPFSTMEPERAAAVLTQLLKKDQEALLDIFGALKPGATGLIFEQMDPETAAEITKLLSDRATGQ